MKKKLRGLGVRANSTPSEQRCVMAGCVDSSGYIPIEVYDIESGEVIDGVRSVIIHSGMGEAVSMTLDVHVEGIDGVSLPSGGSIDRACEGEIVEDDQGPPTS